MFTRVRTELSEQNFRDLLPGVKVNRSSPEQRSGKRRRQNAAPAGWRSAAVALMGEKNEN